MRVLCNRAITLAEHECFDDARSSVKEAGRLAADDPGLRGLVQTVRCRVHDLARDLSTAAGHGHQATRLLEEHGSVEETARAVIYLGSVKGRQGHHLEALNLFNKALTLLRGSSDRRLLVLARWGLGSALGFLERYQEAHDSLAGQGAPGIRDDGPLRTHSRHPQLVRHPAPGPGAGSAEARRLRWRHPPPAPRSPHLEGERAQTLGGGGRRHVEVR